jgi:PD-(D/E)XK nuclease superfamily
LPDPFYASVTEIQEFQQCERLWDWTSGSRQGLVPKGVPVAALHIGTAVHHVCEAQAVGLDPMVELDRWFDAQLRKYRARYEERVGTSPSAFEYSAADKDRAFVTAIMRNYFNRWGWENPIKPFRYIIPELSFDIPFPHILTKDGREMHLVGTTDGVAELEIGPGEFEYYAVEHKSAAQRPNLEDLKVDHQMLGYSACLSHILGVKMAGVLYDGIIKKLPAAPKVRLDGRLSKEFISTTAQEFQQALINNGQKPADPEYASLLQRLRAQERSRISPFWVRHKVQYTAHAERHWVLNVEKILRRIASDPEITYNRPWGGCWSCMVDPLCRTQINGGDLEYALQSYTKGEYGTRVALRLLKPTQMNSIEDLRRIAAERTAAIQAAGHLDTR